MGELTERQRRERELHDKWAGDVSSEELLVEPSFEAATAQENRFILSQFGNLSGKRVLDLGAGAGEASLYFTQRGAKVTALDISPRQLQVLSVAARARGLEVETVSVPAENLPFESNTFDFVYGNGVLHHVDIRKVVPGVLRVMRPGGKAAFIEPLAYNPAIWVYRRLASDVRTPDETPLVARDIRWVVSQFHRGGHREFWLSALLVFVYFYLGERVSPSADRYWKKVIRDGSRYEAVTRPLFALDRALTRIPGVRMLCWNTVLYGEKG